jgi:hypothetical protein
MPNPELPPDGPIDVQQFEAIEVKLPAAILDHFKRSPSLVAAAVVEAYRKDVSAALHKARRNTEDKWDVYAEKLYEAMGVPPRGDQTAAMTRKLRQQLDDKFPQA